MNGSMDSTLVEYSVQEEILKELESVTVSMIRNRSSGTTQCNHKTEEAWDLPQQFCRIHHLPPTQAYLKMCAGQGNWLSFLCHAQRYGFKANDVSGRKSARSHKFIRSLVLVLTKLVR